MSITAATYPAMVCERLDGPGGLVLRRLPRRALEPREVRVRIAAAGVNFPDVLITRGAYQFKPALPFVPGLEAAGEVIELGPGATGVSLGDRVTLAAHTGMFAAEVVVADRDAAPAPPEFSMAEAACYRVAARTARHAFVDRAVLKPGETLLVLGAGGGVGLAAVEIGALLGARVIAAASTNAKLAAAAERGAAHLVNYSKGPLVDAVRAIAPHGVDVVFDPVGGELFEHALRLVAWGGRVLVVGFASGRIGQVPANLTLLKGSSILGVRAGEAARRDPDLEIRCRQQLGAWIRAGHLRPCISDTFELGAAADALRTLEERRAVGRVVLTMPA